MKYEPVTVKCVTCDHTTAEFTWPYDTEHKRAVALVQMGWRRVVGGWRCPECIRREESK